MLFVALILGIIGGITALVISFTITEYEEEIPEIIIVPEKISSLIIDR